MNYSYHLKKILKIDYLFKNKLFNENIELYTSKEIIYMKNNAEFQNYIKTYTFEKNMKDNNEYKYLIKEYLKNKHDFNYINNSINYENINLENIKQCQIKNYIYIDNLLNYTKYNEEIIKNHIINKINKNIINKNYENDVIIKNIIKKNIVY